MPYPGESLSYLANVYNQAARDFYARHGVSMIDAAYEAHQEAGEVPLMVTKHCLRFSFNLCPKQAKGCAGRAGASSCRAHDIDQRRRPPYPSSSTANPAKCT